MTRTIACLLLASSLAMFGQTKPGKRTIFVVTDAEGVAGVCRQGLTETTSPELRQLLTGEVNAAVEGFFAGGADEVIVWDGHGGSATLSAATIHPRARLGVGDGGMLFSRGLAGVAFVGQHARANRRPAVMAHSFSSLGIQHMLMNGKPVGEIETLSALAGSFGVPVIFLSGDQAAVEDLRAVAPEAVGVAVKEGLAYYACISMSATAAREAIQQGAERSMKEIGRMRPYKVEGPVTIQVEYTTRSTLPAQLSSAVEVVDARTLRFNGKSFLEAWKLYRWR
ncbi:MAG TPA: M55 family metallopeptidase [Bryobacteraceae bacterium]|nr:M55 family metallopeptidase [Bryobacteraceae bacterium]